MKVMMIDTETTGLDPRTSLAWEVGCVIFDDEDYQIEEEFSIQVPLSAFNWEPATREFALKTYGSEVVNFVSVVNPGMESLKAMQEEYLFQYGKLANWLEAKYLESEGKLVAVMNHVEFDLPILKRSLARYKISSTFLGFKYNQYFDLQSLCRGAAKGRFAEEYAVFKSLYPAGVAHRAVEDCRSQINMLKHFGVKLG